MCQSENNTVFVTMDHIRAAGGCAPGARTWFKKYGLDFKAFCRDECIDSAILLATGDAFAVRVVEIASKGAADGQ